VALFALGSGLACGSDVEAALAAGAPRLVAAAGGVLFPAGFVVRAVRLALVRRVAVALRSTGGLFACAAGCGGGSGSGAAGGVSSGSTTGETWLSRARLDAAAAGGGSCAGSGHTGSASCPVVGASLSGGSTMARLYTAVRTGARAV
jgi:hypothetical protein